MMNVETNHTDRLSMPQTGGTLGELTLPEGRLRIGLATDIHHRSRPPTTGVWNDTLWFDRALARLETAFAWFASESVDLALILGDLADDGDARTLDQVLEVCSSCSSAPVRVVRGNHDRAFLQGARAAVKPLHTTRGPGLSIESTELEEGANGKQLGRRTSSDDGGLLVVVSHYPLMSRREALEGAGMRYPDDLANRRSLVRPLMRRTDPTLVLCGHLHVDDAHVNGRLLQFVFSSVVEGAGAAAIVDIAPAPSVIVHRTTRALDGPASPECDRWVFGSGRWSNHRSE